jgi:hypothetical protein
MENSANTEKKQSILKSLAVAGLLGITILIAWLAIQLVQVFPAALTSLVGVANSVYNYNPLETREVELVNHTTLINAGESFAVSWNKPLVGGIYTFSYTCIDGVSISLSADEKNFSNLECATEYDLGDTDTVKLFINTTHERFTTVPYHIAFYRPNDTDPTAKQEASVTVVNPELDTTTEGEPSTTPAEETPEESTDESPEVAPEPEPAPEPTPEPEPEVTTPKPEPTTSVPKTNTPEYTYTYTYAIPTSNPAGTADLSVSIVGLGILGANNTFIRTDTITRGVSGALQFAIQNIGDKTSEAWDYVVKLPGGTYYESKLEKALLPNERAVITVSYPAITNSYLENFAITVYTDGTERTKNNNTAGATEIVLN